MTKLLLPVLALALWAAPRHATLRGEVLDAESGRPLACRLSIRAADGLMFFAKSASPDGSAVEYRKQVGLPSIERHVTLSAHPFTVELPPGSYTITVQHGKEYLPQTRQVDVGEAGAQVAIRLQRWINMAERGWYSGETHVHRMPDVLPNVMLAEDLNVALPITCWVQQAYTSPQSANTAGAQIPNDARVTEVDKTHVFYSRNTEYEIFSVDRKKHTLGALFFLNHKTLFEEGMPPVRPIVKKARAEGALLELDKHNWPWSAMLAAVFNVDLYELANNHLWETEFAFRDFGAPAPEFMKIDKDAKGYTEKGWIDYTFQNYYSFLNCGIRMRPTAGCASGVHPVPLGFGRVYVQIDAPFSYDAWIKGLNEGRSFVTTGPMLFVTYQKKRDLLAITAESAAPLSSIQIVINGEVAATAKPDNLETPGKGYVSTALAYPGVDESSWLAVRCFEERPDKRTRFAHSAPIYLDVPGKPLRPRRADVEFLLQRVEDELARNKEVLTPEGLAEYREAADFYRKKFQEAR
jgi:hypothetical protein